MATKINYSRSVLPLRAADGPPDASGAGDAPASPSGEASAQESLNSQYGERIAAVVRQELLGTGIRSESVEDKVRSMAETMREVFEGVNFVNTLHCSAAARSPAFDSACCQAGFSPDDFLPHQLNEIDEQFRAALSTSSGGHLVPLSLQESENLMGDVVGRYAATAFMGMRGDGFA